MNGAMLLQHAAGVIEHRERFYGPPQELFTRIAARWSLVLGIEVTPAQVALCLIERGTGRDAAINWASSVMIPRIWCSGGLRTWTLSIAYEPAAIDERLTYVVRTRVLVGERLMFTSDTANPVLTRGAPREIAVIMRMVPKRHWGCWKDSTGIAVDDPER